MYFLGPVTNTKKNIVAVAILAGMGLCLAAIYYAGEQLGAGMPGPSKIGLAPDGTVWVASHGGLHQFTAAGERRRTVALSALGRGAVISELLPLSDGTLVIAEAVPSAAWRCDIGARVCSSITAKVAASHGPTAHALMVAADEQRGRFYISDNANHRLLLLDFDGKVLAVTAPRRLLYPNELTVEKSGQLVVVDTTHRRLVRIPVEGDAFGPDLWQMKTDNPLLRPGRRLPMDLAPSPGGEWWVVIARDGMKEGDLVLFGADGNALRRVDLGADSDPTQIAIVPDGLLVADPSRATLTRVAPDGSVAGPWGDAAFQAELGALRESRSLWSMLRIAAQVLLVAFPVAGVLLLWRLGERLPIPGPLAVPAAPTPVERGIRWLEVRPEVRRRGRRTLMVLSGAMWVAAIAFVVLLASGPAGFSGLMAFFAAGVLVVSALAPLPLLIWMPRVWRMRLGTDGRRFFFDPGNGKVQQHEFGALATSNGRQLLVGDKLIILRGKQGPLFEEDEMSGLILARIPPSGRVGSFRLFALALGRGSRDLWAALIIVAIAIAFLLLPKLFPAIPAYFKAMAAQFLGAK